jgi:hypothetical protein
MFFNGLLAEIDNDRQILAVAESDPQFYGRMLDSHSQGNLAALKDKERGRSDVSVSEEERRSQVLKISAKYGLPLSGNKELYELNAPNFNAFVSSFKSAPDIG